MNTYMGQIMMASFDYAPKGYALCNGQTLPLQQYQALFSLLGLQYGGNGTSTFMLPNLCSRTPVGSNTSRDPSWQPTPYTQGASLGAESVTLLQTNLPLHTHPVGVTTANGIQRGPSGEIYSNISSGGEALYSSGVTQVPLNPATVSNAGGSQPHDNIQPFLTISFAIALTGMYPSRG